MAEEVPETEVAEEGSGMPSVPKARREIEIGRGVVLLPPEKIPKKEEAPAERPSVSRPPPSTERAPSSSNIVAILAILFALVGLGVGGFAIMTTMQMKTELKAIAADLRAFKEAPITINTILMANHTVDASLPVKEVVAPFTLPIVPQEISGRGVINVILPGYGYPVPIPWNGTITISGLAHVDPSKLSADQKIVLSYSLPGKGTLLITMKGEDIWTDQLEDITNRLERVSN